MKLLFSLIILASLTIFTVQSDEMAPPCVTVTKSENQPAGQTAFTFTNTCKEKMYINACVANASGEIKLYKSFKAVPPEGKFTIYTFPNTTTDDIHFVADTSDPGIPPSCLLH